MTLDWNELVSSEFTDDKMMLEEMYLNQKMSIEAIAAKIGVSKQSIRERLKKHRIETRPRGGRNNTRKRNNVNQETNNQQAVLDN